MILSQHKVGDGDLMVRVNVSGERSERAVGHANSHGRRMLERIRHRKQQYFHWSRLPKGSLATYGRTFFVCGALRKLFLAPSVEFVYETALSHLINKAELDKIFRFGLGGSRIRDRLDF